MSARDEIRHATSFGPSSPNAADRLLDAHRAESLAEGLSAPERAFLTFALDLAADRMASRGDEFTGEDEAALISLRAMATATPAAPVPVPSAEHVVELAERLRAELAELTARARRVAVSHEHFIQDHDDPGTEALAAQYELINHLSGSADPGDLPLNPVETALRVVLAVLDETQDDASPREIRGAIADALPREDKSDHRHRIYIDGRGDAWMDVSVEADGTTYIAQIEKSFSVGTPMTEVAERTGSLREIGRCW